MGRGLLNARHSLSILPDWIDAPSSLWNFKTELEKRTYKLTFFENGQNFFSQKLDQIDLSSNLLQWETSKHHFQLSR